MQANLTDKLRAYRLVQQAQSRGELAKRQPCEICADPKGEGHHEDYSRPLELTWLCRFHHGLRHRELKKPRRSNLKPRIFTLILSHGERVPSDKMPSMLGGGVPGYIQHVEPYDFYDANLYSLDVDVTKPR